MKSAKVMKGGKCDSCIRSGRYAKCGGGYGGYGKGVVGLKGAMLVGGSKKRGAVKKGKKGKGKGKSSKKSKKVKKGGSVKCPGYRLNLGDQILGKSVVDRYETCELTN